MSLGPNEFGKPPPSDGPFTIIVTLVAKDDASARELVKTGNVISADSNKVPGCTMFRFTQAVDDAKSFVAYEQYTGADALDECHKSEAFQRLIANLSDWTSVAHARYHKVVEQ